MKVINGFISFFIIFIKIKKIFQSHIVYPFRKSTKEIKLYPENLLQNDLEITLEIGTPPQKIDVNLRSHFYTLFVSNSNVKLEYPTFNESNSESFIRISKNYGSVINQEYRNCIYIYESIIINKKEIKNISLVLAASLAYKEAGALGLRLLRQHDFGGDLSFIYQMKNKANLDNYAFTLRYDNDNKGELIIGSYPHLYDKKYKEKNFYYSKVGDIERIIDWVLYFDYIKYDNKTILGIINKSLIQIEFGLIQAPLELKQYFNENYFLNQCKEDFYSERNITILHCNKNLDITKF